MRNGFFEYLSTLLDSNSPYLEDVRNALEKTQDGKHVNYPLLAPKDRETAVKSIDMWDTEAKRLAKEKLTNAQNQIETDFVDDLIAGKLTQSKISNSILSGDDQWKWISRIDEYKQKAKKAAEGDGEFKTDKTVEADIYSRIVTAPESVDDNTILERIGSGLSKATAKALIDEKRSRITSGLSDPSSDTIFKNLQADQKAGIFGDGQEGGIKHAKRIEEYIKWRKKNPDVNPSQWYESTIEPEKKGWFYRLWDAVTGNTESTHPLKGKPPGRYKVDGKIIKWDGMREMQ